ncbi:hypothetical protein BN159_2059 [Streptomyces davaonensis JCM 4913]|uniref:Uncharacterized protein n=2 Tax=Streptomyces davaonensis TaxID=348043 RepID=K4QZE1_STRDJ|nr:hypothetical protein BN159_2059 [Streptomyces davaonensis JCM 4913]
MERTERVSAAGNDDYDQAFRYFSDSREHKPVRYEVLKRCSLMTCLSEPVFVVATDGLDYSFDEMRRVLAAYPAEAGWYQLNGVIRKGAWAAWWKDDREAFTAEGLPAAMAETAARLASHLTRADGNTAMVERLRLLVLAGRHREAGEEFDKWYPAFENVADFAVCRKLAEAIAPDDLRRFAADTLDSDLLRRRERAERRLEMSQGLHEYFEQTRHYVSRRDVEGILESAVHGTVPPPVGRVPDGIPAGPPRVIHLHASGGMGKSTQLAWLVSRFGIQQHPPVISAVLDAQTMVSQRLLDLPELLLVNAAERFLEQAQVLDRRHRIRRMDAFLRSYGHRRRELDQEFDPPGNTPLQRWNAVPLPTSIVSEFADALNDIAHREPVLFCLDTTDELLQAPEEEMAALLRMLSELVRQVPWLRVVLSGRADVTEQEVFRTAFRDLPWRALELKPFTAHEAQTYLRLRGIAADQAERIVAVCEQDIEGSPAFNPLVLALLAGSPDKLPTAGDSLYLFVVDRELSYIKDDYARNALKYCAVARHPTYEYFLKVLVPLLSADSNRAGADEPEDPRDLWDRLIGYARRSAWIRAKDTRLDVHVNVRRELRRTMRSEEGPAWRQFHRDAARRCAGLAQQAGSAEETAGWVAEQVYHQLHSAVDRHSDHDAFLDGVAQTWHRQVALAWQRGDFATVIDLADRLLSADLESPESERDGLGLPDPRVMPLQLWYDIALERAYGELHAVLYGGRPGWFDVERYLKLVGRRTDMTCPDRPPVRQDRLRVDVITAALRLHEELREGLAPVREAYALLHSLLEKTRQADDGPAHALQDLWVADAQLLLASCQVRIGRTQEQAHFSHAEADRAFAAMFDAAVSGEAPQARLVARYAMQDWDLADRPDLVRAWQRRLETIPAPVEDWVRLAAAEAELRSGLPLTAEPSTRSGFSRDALRADLLQARSQLLVGEAEEAERLLREVTLPAVSGQMEPELAFETLMVLARASAQMLELEQAESYARMAMGRASDDERRLSVMALRAGTALSVAGDLGRADQWISRSEPLREDLPGAAGTAMNGAECALLHRWGRFEEAETVLRRWRTQLRSRRDAPGRSGTPPTAAEWLSYGLHALVCGPVGEVRNHLATVTTALESIPGPNRRFMLLAEQARLYATIAEKPLITERARIDAFERLLDRDRSDADETGRPAGLAALWRAELHTLMLGGGPRSATAMRTAAHWLGPDNRLVHATWLRLHRLLPAEPLPDPLPKAEDHDPAQRVTLRAADLIARAQHKSRRQRRKAAEEAAELLRLTTDTDVPTVWHLHAARNGADVGIPADALAEMLDTPLLEEARRRNLQFALRRLGRYEGPGLPTGKADESWRKAWAAYQREARGEVPAHLRQAVLAAAEERPVTQIEVDVQGDAVGSAPRPGLESAGALPSDTVGGALVWRATEDFLLSPEPLGVAGNRPVDVILLHGEMRPFDQGAALRLPGSARSIRPEDVDSAVRNLCAQRRQPPPLVVLDALPQETADGNEAQLRDLFAFQLHLLGYVPAVLASGPVGSDPDGSWRRTALAHAVAFGRTAHQIAERLQHVASRQGEDGRRGPRIRLLTHIPEEETFGIGLL